VSSHASNSKSALSPARARISSTSQRCRPTLGTGSGADGSTETRQRVSADVGCPKAAASVCRRVSQLIDGPKIREQVPVDGIPLPSDVARVAAYLDTVRPVTIKDFFVVAPIPFPVNVPIQNLVSDDSTTRANITVSLESVFYAKQQPGQTWFAAWTNEGIADAPGVVSYDLNVPNVVMPANRYMPVLGDITYS
jgi:hypothetical protein